MQSLSLPVIVSKGHLMPTFLNDFQFCKWVNILKNPSNSMDSILIYIPKKGGGWKTTWIKSNLLSGIMNAVLT